MLSVPSHELCVCNDAQLTAQQCCSHQTRNNEITAALLLRTCTDKERMIRCAPIGRWSPVVSPCDPAQPQRPCKMQPHPLEGTACLQKLCLSVPLVLLRWNSIFLLFKEVCYCHQGLYLITERHQREMKHSCDSLEGASWWKPAPSLG